MTPREIIADVVLDETDAAGRSGSIADAILSALKEAGYVVTELEPAREQVWLQNLCGFIDGTFVPLDDRWQEIWKQRVRALAAVQEQEEG